MGKVLSIIIPTYNMEKYLNRCLDSLLVSNMDMIEALVIIDGAKDRSSEIAHAYEDKYPGVFKVIDKENGNYGSCINRGIKEACGKYVKILDADDYYNTYDLSLFISELLNCESDIIFTAWTTVSEDKETLSADNIPSSLHAKTFDYDKFSFVSQSVGFLRRMHCMTVKLNLLRDNGYIQTEGISYTDTQFVFYSFMYAKTFSIYNYNIYQYCLGRDGQTVSRAAVVKNYMHFYINAKRMIEDYKQFVNKQTPEQQIFNLKRCITSELESFCLVVFNYLEDNSQQLKLLRIVKKIGKQAVVKYDISKEISNRDLYIWSLCGFYPKYAINFVRSMKRIFVKM